MTDEQSENQNRENKYKIYMKWYAIMIFSGNTYRKACLDHESLRIASQIMYIMRFSTVHDYDWDNLMAREMKLFFQFFISLMENPQSSH